MELVPVPLVPTCCLQGRGHFQIFVTCRRASTRGPGYLRPREGRSHSHFFFCSQLERVGLFSYQKGRAPSHLFVWAQLDGLAAGWAVNFCFLVFTVGRGANWAVLIVRAQPLRVQLSPKEK